MEQLSNRIVAIRWLVILLTLALILRLFYLQVLDRSYKRKASDIGRKIIYPARGLIYDRNGQLLVSNEPVYDVLVTRSKVINLDTNLLATLLNIPDSILDQRFKILQDNKKGYYSPYKPAVLISQISPEDIIAFQEKRFLFPGFSVQSRSLRHYPFSIAGHIMGDMGEVNDQEIERYKGRYVPGDYIGKGGLELQYEQLLRGNKGVRYFVRDKLGRKIGQFEHGKFDTAAVEGKTLITSLDVELQAYAEWLMHGKRGSIVAIEPSTGQILAMVSSPGYDPNLLVGRNRGHNYKMLLDDTINKPLINRPLTAMYPPGSTFKPIMGLIALQENILNIHEGFSCHGGFYISGLHIGCHNHGPVHSLTKAIEISCNTYFCQIFARMISNVKYENEDLALSVWDKYLFQMEMGLKTGIDLHNEYSGNIPTPEYYKRIYGNYRWRASTIISDAFGQGEILVTPLQLANVYAIIANRGFYFKPHLLVQNDGDTSGLGQYYVKNYTDIDSANYELIMDGLEMAVELGTAKLARVDSVIVCGKTGTAQNPFGEDHSIFAAFAPRNHPKIAIAVFIENAGFGGTWAAPIAGLLIEKYLKGYIPKNKEWLENYAQQKVMDYYGTK